MGTTFNGDGLGDGPWPEVLCWVRKRFEIFLTTLPTGVDSLKPRGDIVVLQNIVHKDLDSGFSGATVKRSKHSGLSRSNSKGDALN